MKHLKKYEEVGYELDIDNAETGEDALTAFKRQRDEGVDEYLVHLGDIVDHLRQAKESLMEIDSKGYNQESIDGIQKVIDNLEI